MNVVNNANTTYTLTYNPNGGTDAPAPVSVMSNEFYAIFHATSATPLRSGFVFAGWSFSPDGPAEIFADDLFTVTKQDTTVYAIWTEENTNLVSIGSEEENAEPLGVVVSNMDSGASSMGDVFGICLVGVAIVLGVIISGIIYARSPRILSIEEDNN